MEQKMKTETATSTNRKEVSVSSDEKNVALIAHLGGIFFGFIPALLIWLTKKDEPGYVAEQAKEALNFQILVAVCIIISCILTIIVIGILLLVLTGLGNLIFCILAAMKTAEGKSYRYPVSWRLIK
jgi:uncharacterized Tic20 family protein